jgi:GMP reductase
MNQSIALKYEDICLLPNYSETTSRADCSTFTVIHNQQFKLPVMPANMKTVIDYDLARWMSKERYFYIMHRFDHDMRQFIDLANDEDWQTVSISVGVKEHDEKLIEYIREPRPFHGSMQRRRVDFITIDIAHGYCKSMKEMIGYIRGQLGDSVCIIAGNVCTRDAVKSLFHWGADIVKVGIGQGSPCTTKDKTGFTYPMFSCVQDCTGIGPIIADGGIKCNGDIAKALTAGADWVMAGGLFARCVDSPADGIQTESGIQKIYYGSASMENKGHTRNIEGVKRSLDSNGMTYQEKLVEIKQDLQSSISYSGGSSLSTLTPGNVIYTRV